jgi:enoyl-CoA hydratase
MPDVEAALAADEPVDAVLARFRIDPGPGPLLVHAGAIREAFGAESVAEIIGRLGRQAADGSEFAVKTIDVMRSKSPTSMAIALEQMKRGLTMTFAEAMRTDYRIVCRIAEGHDFYEGVRAVIIDKDQNPQWVPPTIDAVDPGHVRAHFAPLPDDLDLR